MRSTGVEGVPSNRVDKQATPVHDGIVSDASDSVWRHDGSIRETSTASRSGSTERAGPARDLTPPKPVSKQRLIAATAGHAITPLNGKAEVPPASHDSESCEDSAETSLSASRTDAVRQALAELHRAGALDERSWKEFEAAEMLVRDLETVLEALETRRREQVMIDLPLAMTLEEQMPLLESFLQDNDSFEEPVPHR